ncbi:MAG: ATP-binding protein [Chlamydiae bacterium]|nr:ATP-binding protein [Chlamydiota bacterium]
MVQTQKGKSPFYPGQPVPIELFVGRMKQIEHIINRGVRQVEAGKPITLYVQGEYGIGKSSIASFVQWLAEKEHKLHGIYAPLGAAENLDDVGAAILEATLRSGAFDPNRSERIRKWLAKYIGDQSLFGVTIHTEALKKEAPTVAKGLLPFLLEAYSRLKDTGITGIFLILDEINGITSNPKFSHFIKGIVDTNAVSREPLPLLFMLCGVEEKRREMIKNHQPIDRIFDVVEINPMAEEETKEFFRKAFESVQTKILPEALDTLAHYSAGFPKIMHLVGDAAYWIDRNGVISKEDAEEALLVAAEEVGKKYVDQQIYKALRSSDYHSILAKIAKLSPDAMNFKKSDVASGLTDTEKKKFNNFLQKMKKLKVLKSGDIQGEYVFTMRMVRLYIWLQSLQKEKSKN